MAATEGRSPRIALDSERAVLGAMLQFPDAVPRALAVLKPQAFYYQAHAKVFRAAAALHERHEPVDFVTVCAELTASGDLETCGGAAKLSLLLEAATTAANLEHYARLIRLAYATRERNRIGLMLANGAAEDPVAARDLLASLAQIEAEAEGSDRPADEWASRAMLGSDLVATDLPPLDSWLGDGLLVRGELAFLTGHSGIGKTFLALQLMSALSIGHTFCGIPTRAAKVGFVELEMPWGSVQQRLRALDPARSDLSRIAVVCEPPAAVHVREETVQAALIAFCRMHGIEVLVMDPFNRLHGDDENDNSDMGRVMEGLHTIRRETGVSILVLHHVRKQPSGLPQGGRSRTSSLDSMRGSSRLTNEPATIMALDETKGMVRLDFAKVRHAQEPAPLYLKRNERGFFDVADDPGLAQIKRADNLRLMLERAGDEGISARTAAEILSVTERTVRRDLEALGAVLTVRGKHGRLWVLPQEAPFPEEQGLDL